MVVFQQPNLFSLSSAFICLALFYLLYEWRFSKETFWQVNRVYMLFAPALAWLIPHTRIVVAPEVAQSAAIDPDLLRLLQQMQGELVLEASGSMPRIGEVILGIYLFGVAFMLLRLAFKSAQLLYIARTGKRQHFGDWIFVVHEQLPGPASFFRFVFSSSAQPLPDMILQHELVHVRQHHTLDVLLMECWIALHWYNPLIYRMRTHLRATHEFIADAAVVEQHAKGAFDYARLLISQPLNQSEMLYNTFAAQINSRLRMLARRPSASWRILTHALTLPIGLALALFFSVHIVEASPLAQVVETFEHFEAAPVAIPAIPEKARVAQTTNSDNETLQARQLPAVDTVPTKEKTIVVIEKNGKKDTVEVSDTPKNTMDEALIIVDGVIQPKGTLNSLNPADIQSINVLKGESATALYQEKGQNGVIEIITKKAAANGQQPASATRTQSITINAQGTPATANENIQVTVQGYKLDPKATQKQHTTIRVMSNGELIGEVKRANLAQVESDAVTITDDIKEVRVITVKGKKLDASSPTESTPGMEDIKAVPLKKAAAATARTITLEFSDRQRAEEALKSLKKNRR